MLDAVVAPRKSLGLTALLFVVFEYIFAIFGFAFMRCVRCNTLQCSKAKLTLPFAHTFRSKYEDCDDDFPGQCFNQCSSLFVCFLTTFGTFSCSSEAIPCSLPELTHTCCRSRLQARWWLGRLPRIQPVSSWRG